LKSDTLGGGFASAARLLYAAPSVAGDVWTWSAIDSDSKLVVSWLVVGRDSGYAIEFIVDPCRRLANRVQLTTEGAQRI
jgi:transposase-like protein